VFTSGPGSGKSRAAAAVGRFCKELGLLSPRHLDEVSAAELVGASRPETSALVGNTARPSTGSVLMVNGPHDWLGLPDRGQHVLWGLYKTLTEYRKQMRDEMAVILAGQAEPLRTLPQGRSAAGRPVHHCHRLPWLHPGPAHRHPRRPSR
jgi:hypothetical protein